GGKREERAAVEPHDESPVQPAWDKRSASLRVCPAPPRPRTVVACRRPRPWLESHLMHVLRRPFYGWWIIIVGALVAYSSGPGQSYTFSVFIDSIIEDTSLSRTAISALYAVGTGVSAVMVMTVSRLADRYGARQTLIAAAIGLGIACFAMSWARGALLIFLAFSALRALGQG